MTGIADSIGTHAFPSTGIIKHVMSTASAHSGTAPAATGSRTSSPPSFAPLWPRPRALPPFFLECKVPQHNTCLVLQAIAGKKLHLGRIKRQFPKCGRKSLQTVWVRTALSASRNASLAPSPPPAASSHALSTVSSCA
eukprot:4436135-Pleurochrysis_carterae.AAC.1